MPTLSIIVPVYLNEETISHLAAALNTLSREVCGEVEVVFVVDGSPDRSLECLRAELPNCEFQSEVVVLSRNFGSFAAIRIGLARASGDYFAVMAADLQEPPELLTEFFERLVAEEADIVVGERRHRDDPLSSRLTSSLFWWTYRSFVQREMPAGGIDVFGCNLAVRNALLSLEESHSSLVGQLIWVGFRRVSVPYDRRGRVAGVSAWTMRKKIRYMLDSIFSFTDLPITLLGAGGVLGICVSLGVSAIVLATWLSGHVPVPGYTPLILTMMFSTSLTLLGFGIIGNYVWRTFENSKRRPLVLPAFHESYEPKSEEQHASAVSS